MEQAKGASVAQLVEHHVANVIVAGSIPVTRSIFFTFFPVTPVAPFFPGSVIPFLCEIKLRP